jgi:probable F420-dependent oxidoreductase
LRLDATIRGVALGDVAEWAHRCETMQFDGVFATETNNDPFITLTLAATRTSRLRLGTGIAIAPPRSPMHLAYTGWEMQDLAGGRFILGLGSQIRAHVERRFSASWERPAERMREMILALRAIWDAWRTGEQLRFEGAIYRHTLMPPAFRPRPHLHPPPPIFLAGVRERMIRVAGEVSDGLLVHPLQSPRYLRETVVPALERGLESAGRRREDVPISVAVLVATSEAETEEIRRRIAFYGSTPAYHGVLLAHGWQTLGTRLHELSRSGGWAEMTALVDDEVLDTFAVRAPDGVAAAAEIHRRYDGVADRVNLHAAEVSDLRRWSGLAEAMTAIGAGRRAGEGAGGDA